MMRVQHPSIAGVCLMFAALTRHTTHLGVASTDRPCNVWLVFA